MAIVDKFTYPTQPAPLQDLITKLIAGALPAAPIEGQIAAAIVPISDMSDAVSATARVFKCLEGQSFDTVVLISPCHYDSFDRINVCTLETYRTPLGKLEVNSPLANELCDEDDDIFLDDTGHFDPRGIDVCLPYLQTMFDSFDILPIIMGDESPMFCTELGHALGEMTINRRILILAMAGVQSCNSAAFEEMQGALRQGESRKLLQIINSEDIEMEGRGPLSVALLAASHGEEPTITILDAEEPEEGAPGYITAILSI